MGCAILLSLLSVVVPIVILHWNKAPVVEAPLCSGDQVPFALTIHPGSYIDLVPGRETSCGRVPELCLRDFQTNLKANDPSDQMEIKPFLTMALLNRTRIIPANDLLTGQYYFFVGLSHDFQNDRSGDVLSGCATSIVIPKRTTIYQIVSVNKVSPVFAPNP